MSNPNDPKPPGPPSPPPPPPGPPVYDVGKDDAASVAKAFASILDQQKADNRGRYAQDRDPNPERPGTLNDTLKRLAEVLEKLEQGQRNQPAGPGQPGGADGWAQGVLKRFGGKLGGRFQRTVGKWFGDESGNLAGRAGNWLKEKALKRLRKYATDRATKQAGRTAPKGGGQAANAGRAAGGAGEAAAGAEGVGAAAGAEGAAGAAAGAEGAAAAGPVGIVLAALILVAEAAIKFKEELVKAGHEQNELNLRFAEFSASMARVAQQDEIDRERRNRETGDKTAATAGALQREVSRYDDQNAQFERLASNVKNIVLTPGMAFLTESLRPFAVVAQKISDKIDEEAGGRQSADMHDHIERAFAEEDRKKRDFHNWRNANPPPWGGRAAGGNP